MRSIGFAICKRVRLDPTTPMEYYGEYEFTTPEKIGFVRAEVYDNFGTLLLMTNPIYYTTDIKNIKKYARPPGI